MYPKLLLPHGLKKIGWLLLIPATIAGLYLTFSGTEPGWLQARVFALFNGGVFEDSSSFTMVDVNLASTLVGVVFIAGAIMVGFSKEKSEDEFIARLRLSSLLWAVCINYLLLLLCFVFIYGTAFFTVMIYNMFTVLILFIIRFHYLLYKHSTALPE